MKVKVKVTQSCPTLCDPMNYTVHGILQAGILEWITFPFSRGSSQPRDQTKVSCIAGGFFTSWATREAHFVIKVLYILASALTSSEKSLGALKHCLLDCSYHFASNKTYLPTLILCKKILTLLTVKYKISQLNFYPKTHLVHGVSNTAVF